MSGLFVQKHVEAVRAQGVDVRVIFSSEWRDMLSQWRTLRREWGFPDVVQLNVIQKQGALALWLKRRYHIPYIIVEHWSGYLPENGQYMRQSATKKRFAQRVCENAEVVMTVSRVLEQAMKRCGLKAKKWARVNNVVDDFFFSEYTKPQNQDKKILLHVSCFDERAKNVKGLLRAAKILSEKRKDWHLVLVGTGIDYEDVRHYAENLDLPAELLEWAGELIPNKVAELMKKSDALVLCSRYETYGVVLAEAAVAGLRILSTPVGIAEEIGALIVPQEIAQNKPGRFAEFMEAILWNETLHIELMPCIKRFSAEAIGAQLKGVYESIIK